MLGLYRGGAADRARPLRTPARCRTASRSTAVPILAICDTIDDVVDEVHITVVHEIAHHFGIDDDRLHDLGYG
ncbi:MAG: metallopeptidase family protein [Dermatophilaceae bacterium]